LSYDQPTNKGAIMLIELKDIEAYVQPEKVLTQALQEGDVTVGTAVSLCIDVEDVNSVLDAIDNKDIRDYCDSKNIYSHTQYFESITKVVKELSQPSKAQLVWMLLKCEG